MNNMLYILGEKLAQSIGRRESTCRGLLLYAVTDSVERLSEAPFSETMAYVNRMKYDDWKAVVEGSALSNRLANVKVGDPVAVTAQLKQTLVENQSLLTMSAR